MAKAIPASTSLVFVTGAWHTERHAEPVVPHFEKAGYRIVPRTLPSAGGDKKYFEDDVEAIQSAITSELQDGRHVCLIMHSAAGVSGSEAVNRILEASNSFDGKIIRLVYVSAFLQYLEITKHMMETGQMRYDMDKGIIHAEKAGHAFFNDMSVEDARPFVAALTFQNAYGQPDLSSERWREVLLT